MFCTMLLAREFHISKLQRFFTKDIEISMFGSLFKSFDLFSLFLLQSKDEGPLFIRDWLNTQSRFCEHCQVGERTFGSLVLEMIVLEFLEWDVALERTNILHVHHRPLGVLLAALWIIVGVLLVKLGVVNISFFNHFHKSNYSRHLGIAVVEESLLTNFHRPHVVPSTVVPNPVPASSAGRLLSQRLKGERHVHPVLQPRLWFRLDQPFGRTLLLLAPFNLFQLSLCSFLRWHG